MNIKKANIKIILFILFILKKTIVFSGTPIIDSIDIKAFAFFQQGKFDSAYSCYNKLINLQPSNERFYLKRGEISFIQKNYNQAIEDFLTANNLKPGFASLYLAKTYSILNFPDKSLFYLQQHLKSKYKIQESEIKLDTCFFNLSKTNEWQTFWDKKWYSEKEKLISEVVYLIKYEKYYDALEIINKNIHHESSIWFYLRGKTFSLMNQYHLAVNDFYKALKKSPNNIEYIEQLAINLYKNNDYNKAIFYFNKILEKQAFRIDIYKYIAQSYESLKNYNKACFYYEKYTELFDTDYETLYNLGLCYLKNDNLLKALKIFNNLIKFNNLEPKYYIARGETYLKTNTYNYAEKDFSMALDFNPENSKVYLLRGITRLKQGNLNAACKDWQTAEKLGNVEATVYKTNYCK